MMELIGVGKVFDDQEHAQHVLAGIDLEVQKGEFLCLMGPSGCGKSTLLRIMAGLDKPTSGKVVGRSSRVAFVFQSFGLMPWLSVYENIAYGLKMAGQSESKINHTVIEKMHLMGLNGMANYHPKELSGGQKQRVGIARALAMDPDILMLDEPFSALDAFTAEELRRDLLKVWHTSGRTIVMVTHSPEEAAELADRIILFGGHPSRIIKEVANSLPRPRDLRSPATFKLVDELESFIRPAKG